MQLDSGREVEILFAIGKLSDELSYRGEEVCGLLVEVVRKGAGEVAAEEAGKALVPALGRVNSSVSAKMIRENLFVANDLNGQVLSRIIAATALSGVIRKAAIEMLSRYKEGDIGRDTMREIERMLAFVVSNIDDDLRIRKEVRTTFSMKASGPRISIAPPAGPPFKPKGTKQGMGGGPKKPVRA